MSHAVVLAPVGAGVGVLVVGVAGLVEALAETGLEIIQQSRFQTDDGKTHAVNLVVRDATAGASVGITIDTATGQARFIAGDCRAGGVKGRALAGRIAQRHAFHAAVGELRRKGYTIAKQQTSADGTVTVVARRWR